jgi:very-short-patch-repair endonuclease
MVARCRREIDIKPQLGAERRSRALDAALAALASGQRGIVGRDQLIALGFGRRAIAGRLAARRLHVVHRGVYAVGHRHLSREARYLAAVLFAGRGAVLSHRAAADLWELRATKERTIDVTVPTDRRGDAAVRIHRRAPQPHETTTRRGIPVTTPLRTLIDLAAVVPEHELERALRQALYRRLTTTARLAAAVHDRRGQRGVKALRSALARLGEAPGLTRSELEERFLRFLRRHQLPLPELNAELEIGGGRLEADCLWRAQRLIVELDGRAAHDSTPAFEADRARDLALLAAGWRTARVTAQRMRRDGDRLAAELCVLLA